MIMELRLRCFINWFLLCSALFVWLLQAQKEALQSGLVTMHDIEMMAIDEEGGGNQGSLQPKLPELRRAFLMKKRAKLRLKSSSSKGKRVGGESVGNPTAVIESAEAMIQWNSWPLPDSRVPCFFNQVNTLLLSEDLFEESYSWKMAIVSVREKHTPSPANICATIT